ncbi:Formate channel 1 [Aggregatibacter actinomycetemcomitans]|uniref:formate transporter FocA n=1 Tax=Aggregatibacter actinomycetemcomitans TaxID=714 RepID=UPI0001B9F371|nr:formate transporter FocA [Aggregatibacter actinomycetemcomitans]ACX83304.1 formate transporter [Aggregatibacter actinomycetemcomitans D11S-1]KOE58804.1 formate transporter [Aggregatibacter actinomycetemcomitans serotype c str. SCC2302]KOE59017.1 formate transporter [Aggregatibacter actinomycetemcomitans serotype c str. AAS4A]KOE61390.1 formate transporter [Aggregatibacter actinomycetemcomitans serotype c str. D17P-2]KYK74768.1 formate transporter [Aggregatibacter actinomycetemcomitans serot
MDTETSKTTCMVSPAEMSQIGEDVGVYKASKRQILSFFSAIPAGAFIALAFVFYTTTQTGSVGGSWGLTKLVGGIVFSLGVIMVVVCGSELFTSSTMTTVARAGGRISTFQMLRNWVVVYCGNFVGAIFIVLVIWFSGQTMAAHGQWGLTILSTAQHKIHHTWIEAFCLGILCNIMVCIAIWMTYAGKTLTDKAFIMILPIALFVASGFEHSVANMFMIPMGIITAHFSSPEFWQAINMDPQQFADLDLYHFVVKNLIPVTLGNIVGGGCCIALTLWSINRLH